MGRVLRKVGVKLIGQITRPGCVTGKKVDPQGDGSGLEILVVVCVPGIAPIDSVGHRCAKVSNFVANILEECLDDIG